MVIKHLVIGGGGPGGFINYGILKESNKQKIWKYENIETIYATSAGVIIALPVLLKINWDWIDDYLIKRPWYKVFKLNSSDYFRLLKDRGIIGKEDFIDELIGPLLKSVDLQLDITLIELFEKFPIQFSVHSYNINEEYNNQLTSISYKTHPNLLLKDVIYMTMCVPLIAKPFFLENACFLDGGLLGNIPLKNCLNETNCKKEEVVVIIHNREIMKSQINKKTGLWSYLIELYFNFSNNLILLSEKYNLQDINDILVLEAKCKNKTLSSFKYWLEVINKESERESLINSGVDYITDFIKTEKYKSLYFNKNIKNYLTYCSYKNNIKRSYSF